MSTAPINFGNFIANPDRIALVDWGADGSPSGPNITVWFAGLDRPWAAYSAPLASLTALREYGFFPIRFCEPTERAWERGRGNGLVNPEHVLAFRPDSEVRGCLVVDAPLLNDGVFVEIDPATEVRIRAALRGRLG